MPDEIKPIPISVEINGCATTRVVAPSMTLLDFLREELGLTGTKRGCDTADCGCCAVLLNGKVVLSCLILVAEVEGAKVTTIEGISNGIKLHPVQHAMVECGAIQCGFCTPAMVVNAVDLLNRVKQPSRDQIKEVISGTICRCTGYTKIEQAIDMASKRMGDGL